MMHRCRLRSRDQGLGFTLVEMMMVIGVIAVLLAVGIGYFDGLKRHEQSRTAVSSIGAYVQLARSAALMLGGASGTARAQLGPSCQTFGLSQVFSTNNSTQFGRAAILFQPYARTVCSGANRIACCSNGRPCDLVTLVTNVERQPVTPAAGIAWPGDNYLLHCTTFELASPPRSLVLRETRFQNFQSGPTLSGTGTYYLSFDSRGFVAGPTQIGHRVGLENITPGQSLPSTAPPGVVITTSGLACPEGANLQCLRAP